MLRGLYTSSPLNLHIPCTVPLSICSLVYSKLGLQSFTVNTPSFVVTLCVPHICFPIYASTDNTPCNPIPLSLSCDTPESLYSNTA